MWAIKMNLIGTCFRICINVVLSTWLKWGSLALAYKFVLSDDATSFPSKLITNQIALKKRPRQVYWFYRLVVLNSGISLNSNYTSSTTASQWGHAIFLKIFACFGILCKFFLFLPKQISIPLSFFFIIFCIWPQNIAHKFALFF